MANLGRQISGFMHDLIPPGSDAESVGPQVSAEVKALLPLSPIEPFGTLISGFVQTLEGPGPLGVTISNFVDDLLPPNPVEPPATPPNPIEPFGTLISDFVQTLEGSGPPGLAISNFIDGLLPPSLVRPDVPPSPIDPDVIRDLVQELTNPGANPGPPDEPPGSVIRAEIHDILGVHGPTDLDVSGHFPDWLFFT